jgi:hypothetical protein
VISENLLENNENSEPEWFRVCERLMILFLLIFILISDQLIEGSDKLPSFFGIEK